VQADGPQRREGTHDERADRDADERRQGAAHERHRESDGEAAGLDLGEPAPMVASIVGDAVDGRREWQPPAFGCGDRGHQPQCAGAEVLDERIERIDEAVAVLGTCPHLADCRCRQRMDERRHCSQRRRCGQARLQGDHEQVEQVGHRLIDRSGAAVAGESDRPDRCCSPATSGIGVGFGHGRAWL